ncbi:DUF973 family protein [Sulfolobus sp. E5-1-F]|uniref:DUF973 family protein n=1 Tax=Sulfolobaceae TaxID=118883 RepID=UPI001297CBBC|nr:MULTISPECIES: DUF973 family protein [unclassified Sulfolobus]QGA53684.1 DUF973 family protein [Sulfolobus sp. E5-1-F]QGA68662.1 DUF973 family protein [Sulfolobus sp. E11-6]
MSHQDSEILGLQKVRKGVWYIILSQAISIPLTIAILVVIFVSESLLPIIITVLAGLVITIPFLILTYTNMKKGFEDLVSIGRDLRDGVNGIILVVIGTVLVLIDLMFIAPFIFSLLISSTPSISSLASSSVIGGSIIFIIGGIIGLIGYVLLFIAFMKTGEIYRNSNVKNGGLIALIGYILSIIISLIGLIVVLIGFYMIYSGLGSVINTISKSQAIQPNPSLPSTPIGQVGVGKLYSNGIAEVTIYSQYQLGILSATILGANYLTSDITPNQLSLGYNVIKINFKTSFMFVAGNIYVIQLTLSNGQTLNVSVVYQP